MASSVYYKFKSQREETKVAFDGTGISVFDLKKEIILVNNLKANDFDLQLFDPSTNQEYKDDNHIIPRSSSVIAKRVPAVKPGKGKAALYLAAADGVPAQDKQQSVNTSASTWTRNGLGVMSMRFDAKAEDSTKLKGSTVVPSSSVTAQDEAAAMAAMFKQQTDHWEETQEKMSHATRIYTQGRGGMRGGKPAIPRPTHFQNDRPLPPSYVCYRCGQKGHWIHDCPTNNDKDFDNRPRIKRTTGIPRSFLKPVQTPSEAQLGQGVMLTPDGGFVVAQPDIASWQKQVARPKVLTEADIREKVPTDSELVCPIDNKLFRDAVKTPCCGTMFCEECIQTFLLENEFNCRQCGKKISSLDKLIVAKPIRSRVYEYIDKAIKESEESGGGSPPNGADTSAQADMDSEEVLDAQPGGDDEMMQMYADSIPQLKAQLAQLAIMKQNRSLPPQLRQSTEYQYNQLQLQLREAEAFVAIREMAATSQGNPNVNAFQSQMIFPDNMFQTPWMNSMPMFSNTPVNATPSDSAYQRLPLNNQRRRNLKRERPSDFLEISGQEEAAKMARYTT